MKRGTIFPILFFVISAVIVGASALLTRLGPEPAPDPTPTPRPGPYDLTVAVHPLAFEWVSQAVEAFNADAPVVDDRPVRIVVVQAPDDMLVWRDDRPWTVADHPNAWIPAASFSVTYAVESALPFEFISASVARTPLVWMGYASRVEAVTEADEAFNWADVVQAAVVESWGAIDPQFSEFDFVNIAFPSPDDSVVGLGVLLSAGAAQTGSTRLSADQMRASFHEYFQPVLNSWTAFIGTLEAYVARANTVHFAMGPEATFVMHLQDFLRNEPVRFGYPEQALMFDFPLVMWQDATTRPGERAALEAFAAWLEEPSRQDSLAIYGLRTATASLASGSTASGTSNVFEQAEPYGIDPGRTFDVVIDVALSSSDIRGLLSWFGQARPG
ncbi:MAG: hypothetical protein ACOCX3_01040 [Chloroflexota bacterium]